MSLITWFGHSTFKVEAAGVSIIIDPFFPPQGHFTYKDAGKVDIVLVTHDHGDHVGNTVQICQETGAMLACVVGTADALVKRGVPADQILNGIGFNIGGTLEYKGVSITMTQAFHSSDSGVPVGYIVKMPDSAPFYHAGDTGIFSSMSLLAQLYNVRLGMLPIGGVFTMDALQAANACKLMSLDKVIPMHWGTFPVLCQSTEPFKKALKNIYPACGCIDIAHGQSMEF